MANWTHNETENSGNGRHSDRLEFVYDLVQCEERCWSGWENFTETITDDLKEYLKTNTADNINVIFKYTCEGSMWFINGKWFMHAVHDFAHKYSIPFENIYFESGNVKIQQVYDKWHQLYAPNDGKINVSVASWCFELYQRSNAEFRDLLYTIDPPTHIRQYKYNNFNRNMLAHRQKLMLAMWENNILDTSQIVSYHYWKDVDHLPWYPVPDELNKLMPIQYDIKGDWQTAFDELFRIDPNHGGGDWNKVGDYRYIYENCYFTITTESSECYGLADYSDDSDLNSYMREFHRELFITEKTTRPMINLHPQIIYCSSGTLDYLKSKGFKTFSNYWNEDYDAEENPDKKIELIISLIKQLSNKPIEELHEMYWDMMPILKHNQELLLNGIDT